MTATFYGVWECDDIIDIDSNKLAMHENLTRVKNRKDLENNQRLSRKTSFQWLLSLSLSSTWCAKSYSPLQFRRKSQGKAKYVWWHSSQRMCQIHWTILQNALYLYSAADVKEQTRMLQVPANASESLTYVNVVSESLWQFCACHSILLLLSNVSRSKRKVFWVLLVMCQKERLYQ